MKASDKERWQKAREHATVARREFRAMWQVLLPEAAWQHAREAKLEAKAAVKAGRRAIKKCRLRGFPLRRPARRQQVEIN